MVDTIVKLPEMPSFIFRALLHKLKCETGEETDSVGFSSDHTNWHFSFYGCAEENYKIVVEDFGREYRKDWLQYAPTPEQLAQLQQVIYDRIEAIEKANRQEMASDSFEEWDETQRFINSNFNRY